LLNYTIEGIVMVGFSHSLPLGDKTARLGQT